MKCDGEAVSDGEIPDCDWLIGLKMDARNARLTGSSLGNVSHTSFFHSFSSLFPYFFV